MKRIVKSPAGKISKERLAEFREAIKEAREHRLNLKKE